MTDVLVIMSDNRKLDQYGYWSHCAYINKIYCDKHGYHFKYVNPYYTVNTHDLNSCIDVNTGEMRHSSWAKLLVILHHFTQEYRYLVFIDSDCVFKNMEISIEEMVNKYPLSDFIFASSFPWYRDMPCAGFFICSNTEKSRLFLHQWYTTQMSDYNSREWQNVLAMTKKYFNYDWNPGRHWEQDMLWILIVNEALTVKITVMDDVSFVEQENQWLRHVCSVCSNDERSSYFSNMVNDLIMKGRPSYQTIIDSVQQEKMDTSSLTSKWEKNNKSEF
jgi:hypothetical protein